ncbi:hypothetical protein DFO73_1159 [Cytobacillus oceanisediminis]|uniref:Uncharacterized protein n=1 Tax=Cytobacillus oceanisediminis TaxID=665099 RepID=A0A2V2ZKH1_9BACI|nr:hypothetical protein DFO73_1159 [Cytobacillus oceanisediminis]
MSLLIENIHSIIQESTASLTSNSGNAWRLTKQNRPFFIATLIEEPVPVNRYWLFYFLDFV